MFKSVCLTTQTTVANVILFQFLLPCQFCIQFRRRTKPKTDVLYQFHIDPHLQKKLSPLLGREYILVIQHFLSISYKRYVKLSKNN